MRGAPLGRAGLTGLDVLTDRRCVGAGLPSSLASPAPRHAAGRDNRAVRGGGGGRDMAPTPNVQYDGTVVWNTVVGDAIAQVLWQYSDELLRFGLEDTRWMGNMCENKVH